MNKFPWRDPHFNGGKRKCRETNRNESGPPDPKWKQHIIIACNSFRALTIYELNTVFTGFGSV